MLSDKEYYVHRLTQLSKENKVQYTAAHNCDCILASNTCVCSIQKKKWMILPLENADR
jgi:hypothetical protein